MAIVEALQDISPKSLEKFSKRLPSRIEDAIEFPTVMDLVRITGEPTLVAYIEFELIRLSTLVSVGGNLTNAQVPFIAQELLRQFPGETIADFKLCFHRGAIGQYGQIFRLDGIVIREWMEKYLEEKYQVIENKLMLEKDHLYKPAPQTLTEEVKDQKVKDRLQEWRETIEKTATDYKIKPLTQEEIWEEGKERPKKSDTPVAPYKNQEIVEMQMIRMTLQRAASEFYNGKRGSFDLKKFELDGVEFLAESEADAKEIIKKAFPDAEV